MTTPEIVKAAIDRATTGRRPALGAEASPVLEFGEFPGISNARTLHLARGCNRSCP